MGQVIQMAWTGLAAMNQQRITNAMNTAQKTIGTAKIDSQNLLNETNANIQNALKGENNTLLAAKAALSNFQRSTRNEAVLRTAGNKVNAATTNILRVQESNARGTLERQIAAAEQQGAITAATAASGTGGASARMLHNTLALTTARREVQITGRQEEQSYDMLAQRAGIMPGAIMALDQGQTFAPVDHTQVTAQKVISPMWEADYQPSLYFASMQAVGGMSGTAMSRMWDSSGSSYKPDSSGNSFGQANWNGGFGQDSTSGSGVGYSYTGDSVTNTGGYSYFGAGGGSNTYGFGAGGSTNQSGGDL
ncbi:internal virion protein [Ralstonia phage RS-PII-1]|uniref:Internal virion protein n=1 Tax=Ralstonia phage RS-PII-1 TaxID=1932892 RepID=A0A1L7DQA8_9CAUD|nr:internal virion protein [Ralstonia phage RS-PII-1]APU00301.1 hypothetical protein [Ralstonia phage RS-PII-1]